MGLERRNSLIEKTKNDSFDTFISYRRDGGSEIASRIYDNLLLKGFSPFYDMTEMHAGRFDEQLKNRIINATNFICILSKNSLNRCMDENDWLTEEITLAISYHLNIILIQEEGFSYPDKLPDKLEKLHLYQTVVLKNNTFHSVMEEVSRLLLKTQDIFTITSKSGTPNKRMRLSGEYITLYEDIENGKHVIIKAPAYLKRVGNKVFGHTAFGSSQTWEIQGTIYKKKRIAGIYYAKNILDEGFGTFFLDIKNNNVLDGFWSGYDNVNRIITSGRYLFRKKYTNYTIQPLRDTDIMEICEIANEQLGKDYITDDLLRNISDSDKKVFCLCATDKTTHRVVGFCIYSFLNSQDAQEISRDQIIELKYARKVGYLKTIAVSPDYTKLGIGSRLVEYCIQQMNREKMDTILSTAWKHAGVINIGGVLQRAGFKKRVEIPDYWLESSIKDKYQCPQCGYPCHCYCVIYTLNTEK